MPETLEPQTPITVNGTPPARPSRRRSFGAVVIMVVYCLPLTGWLIRGNSLSAEVGRELVYWALALGLVTYVVIAERRPVSSIGLRRPTWKSLVIGSFGACLMVAGMAFIYLVIFPSLGLSSNEAGTVAVKALPFWFRVFLIVRAAGK